MGSQETIQFVGCGVSINRPEPFMDLEDDNITVSQKSKYLKSVKEDTKDSTQKILNQFLASYPSNDSPTQKF